MAYLKINGVDYSNYVNQLTIATNHNYNAQTNAAGDTVVDYVNAKRTITVGFIPLTSAAMMPLKTVIDSFDVSLSFRNPNTGALEENIKCIIPTSEIGYYTIQVNKVMYNAFTVSFIEL